MSDPGNVNDRITRATARKRTLDRILLNILDLEPTDGLVKGLTHVGCRNIIDVLSLQDQDIDEMQYKDNDQLLKVSPSQRSLVKVLKAWNYHLMVSNEIKKVDWDDTILVNQEEFDEFRVSWYDPDNPIRSTPRSSTAAMSPIPIHTTSSSSKISSSRHTPAQEFRRGIKRDKTHYDILKDEKQWDTWKRKLESTATAHGCESILDPLFVPTQVDEVALFDEQQKFMYDVFINILRTDRGIHFVRTHSITKDAQSIWREYSNYMNTSTKADLEIQRLMSSITSKRLTTNYRGTTTKFILDWLDDVRRYEEMTPIRSHFPEPMKKAMLQNAINEIKTFADIKTSEEFDIAKGNKPFPYKEYSTLIQRVATNFDEKLIQTQRSRYPRSVNDHHLVTPDYDYDDYNNNDDPNDVYYDSQVQDIEEHFGSFSVNETFQRRGPRRPSLHRDTWQRLSQSDKDTWDRVSDEGKRSIIFMHKNASTPSPQHTQQVSFDKKRQDHINNPPP